MVYDISVFYRLGSEEHRDGEHYSRTTVHSNFCIHIGPDVYAVSSVLNATSVEVYAIWTRPLVRTRSQTRNTHIRINN